MSLGSIGESIIASEGGIYLCRVQPDDSIFGVCFY